MLYICVISLRDLKLNNLLDFEYVNAILESLRDATLRVKHFKADLVASLYTELRAVMPRLEVSPGLKPVVPAGQPSRSLSC